MSYGNTPAQEIARLRGELEYVSRAISTMARKIIRDRVNTALAYKLPETARDGEFICSVCHLRKPGDVVEDDERPPF